MNEKMNSLMLKLDLWESCVKSEMCKCFDTLHNFLIEYKISINVNVTKGIAQVKVTIRAYFDEPSEKYDWVKNPFQNHFNQKLTIKEREQIIDVN